MKQFRVAMTNQAYERFRKYVEDRGANVAIEASLVLERYASELPSENDTNQVWDRSTIIRG